MLIDSGRLISELREGWTDQRAHHAAAAVGVIVAGFVEYHDEQAVLLEDRVLDQRIDVVFEPVIGGTEAAIVGIIATVGGDEGVVGKVSRGEILGQLCKGHQVLLLGGAVLHIGEIGNGDMANVILPAAAGGVAAEVADRGQAFGISLPALAATSSRTTLSADTGKLEGVWLSLLVRTWPVVNMK